MVIVVGLLLGGCSGGGRGSAASSVRSDAPASASTPPKSAGAPSAEASATPEAGDASPSNGAGAASPSNGAGAAAGLAGIQERWLAWVASQPQGSDPVSDTTGASCGRGQHGDVWLVAGSFGETVTRACTMPAGTRIAGPALNLWSTPADECDAWLAKGVVAVRLDANDVEVTAIEAESVTFSGVADNVVSGRAGKVRTTVCGLWFSVPPLSPGEHTLSIVGKNGTFRLKVKYALTVV